MAMVTPRWWASATAAAWWSVIAVSLALAGALLRCSIVGVGHWSGDVLEV
jgi:hypothetical protein